MEEEGEEEEEEGDKDTKMTFFSVFLEFAFLVSTSMTPLS
jgi:hypothetical protein